MILFKRGNFKIGKRRGHFIGDPTLSNRADGDLLIVDLFFVSILHFTPNIKLTNAIKRLVTHEFDFSWHKAVKEAEKEARQRGYKLGEQDAEREKQRYYDLCEKYDERMGKLSGENVYLREAFRILTSDKVD